MGMNDGMIQDFSGLEKEYIKNVNVTCPDAFQAYKN